MKNFHVDTQDVEQYDNLEINSEYRIYFKDNAPESIKKCIEHFHHHVFSKLEGEDYWVAGGAIRDFFLRQPPVDIDLFSSNHLRLLDKVWPPFSEETESYTGVLGEVKEVLHNNNCFKVKFKDNSIVDIVKAEFKTPKDTIKTFDFTVSAAAVTSTYFIAHEDYFMDLASRSLRFNAFIKTLPVVSRVQKYIKKGFTLDNQSLVLFAKMIRKLPFERISEDELYVYPTLLERIAESDRGY